jgi:hypothetical protein
MTHSSPILRSILGALARAALWPVRIFNGLAALVCFGYGVLFAVYAEDLFGYEIPDYFPLSDHLVLTLTTFLKFGAALVVLMLPIGAIMIAYGDTIFLGKRPNPLLEVAAALFAAAWMIAVLLYDGTI